MRLCIARFPARSFAEYFVGNQAVFVGTPRGIVHSIQDSHQPVGAGADNSFQSEPEFRSLNLLRILPAHRRQIVGINQAAFQKIDVSKKLDSAGMVNARGNARTVQCFLRKNTVIADVVDGENRRQIL